MATGYELGYKREYSLFYGVAACYGAARWLEEDAGIGLTVRGEGKDGFFSQFYQKGAMQRIKDAYLKRVRNAARVKLDLKRLEESGEKLVNFSKALMVSRDFSDKELFALYAKYYELLEDYCSHLYRSFYLPEAAAAVFEEAVREKVPLERQKDVASSYSHPSKRAFTLAIGDYFKKVRDLRKRVSYLEENYPWLGSLDPFGPLMLRKELADYAKSFVAPPARKKSSFKLHDPIVRVYQDMLYLKDKRDQYRREAFYYARPLVEEVAGRLGVSVNDLGYLLPLEARLGKIGEIRKRKQGYVAEVKNGRLTIKSAKAAKFLHLKEKLEGGLVKGVVGCAGKAKGRVCLVRSKKDLRAFKEGRVLVATTTHPEYLGVMHKAIAFVTDEGGVTSHAAIVARELGKPCIVGTKVATRVLKNGSMVEVNANEGVVRIID